jgi:hypothetical protein
MQASVAANSATMTRRIRSPPNVFAFRIVS